MHRSTRILFLLAALAFVLAGPVPAAHPHGRPAARGGPPASPAAAAVSIRLPGRRLEVSARALAPAANPGAVQAGVTVTVTNTGRRAFSVQPDEFALSAEGDMFGQAR